MRRYLLCLLLALALLPLAAQMTIPRVYVQKVILDNGKNPFITWYKDKSAPEYTVRTWILDRPDEIMSTETQSMYHVSLRQVGDGKKFPHMAIVSVQLGNFKSQWKAGEILHVEVIHKESKQKTSWDINVPEGSNLIKHLDDPIVIPPYTPKAGKCSND
jgi:hypothetical protein